jgi:hypothetical protein
MLIQSSLRNSKNEENRATPSAKRGKVRQNPHLHAPKKGVIGWEIRPTSLPAQLPRGEHRGKDGITRKTTFRAFQDQMHQASNICLRFGANSSSRNRCSITIGLTDPNSWVDSGLQSG